MTLDKENISIAAAEDLIQRAFVAVGVPEASALSVARALVAAEAEGQVGHGFSRLADYAAQAKSGKIRADAVPSCEATSPAALLIDAGYGFAYPALDLAIERGTEVAREYGCASMSIARSHHCGALSVQVERIAQAGLVGMMVANSPAAIAPWGAKTSLYGTNPIAFAVPRPGKAPLVIDLSLSRVARGKVMHAKKSGTTIPDNWALDAEGNPTTDPDAALQGSMLPIGGAKGTVLALMVEILSSVMTGANTSSEAGSFFTADGPPPGTGQFLLAMKPHDPDGFAARLEHLLGLIEALEGARLPGTRRASVLAQSRENGLDVPRHYLDAARALANGNG